MVELRRLGDESLTGKLSSSIQLLMYERTILPAITYNLESWSYWRKSDWESIERIQADALRSMFRLPSSTPYWGLIGETGLWSVRACVDYKTFMLLQNRSCSKIL